MQQNPFDVRWWLAGGCRSQWCVVQALLLLHCDGRCSAQKERTGSHLLVWAATAANDRRLCPASVSKQLASGPLARGYSWPPFRMTSDQDQWIASSVESGLQLACPPCAVAASLLEHPGRQACS